MRPNWKQHWLSVAKLVSEMSTCAGGRRVGAVFVRDKRLLVSGFNGQAAGSPHPETCARRDRRIP